MKPENDTVHMNLTIQKNGQINCKTQTAKTHLL